MTVPGPRYCYCCYCICTDARRLICRSSTLTADTGTPVNASKSSELRRSGDSGSSLARLRFQARHVVGVVRRRRRPSRPAATACRWTGWTRRGRSRSVRGRCDRGGAGWVIDLTSPLAVASRTHYRQQARTKAAPSPAP